MQSETYHIPALLPQALELLDIKPDGVYVDVTFGGGGHSRGLLEALGPEGRLYGFDRDLDAMANIPADDRFTFVHSDYRYIANFMRYHGEEGVDGILADLGVSFHHFDTAERGFTFRAEAPLDMRMNTLQKLTAADVVNSYDTRQLCTILDLYGEMKHPIQIVRAIEKARAESPLLTTTALVAAVEPVLNPARVKKEMAKLFQALRIEVNGEMDSLQRFLKATTQVLRPGGRLAVITYHSLEDRMVKNFMRAGNVEGKVEKDFFGRAETPWEAVTRSPITPDAEEVERNPRSRSAKLRVARLIDPEEK